MSALTWLLAWQCLPPGQAGSRPSPYKNILGSSGHLLGRQVLWRLSLLRFCLCFGGEHSRRLSPFATDPKTRHSFNNFDCGVPFYCMYPPSPKNEECGSKLRPSLSPSQMHCSRLYNKKIIISNLVWLKLFFKSLWEGFKSLWRSRKKIFEIGAGHKATPWFLLCSNLIVDTITVDSTVLLKTVCVQKNRIDLVPPTTFQQCWHTAHKGMSSCIFQASAVRPRSIVILSLHLGEKKHSTRHND